MRLTINVERGYDDVHHVMVYETIIKKNKYIITLQPFQGIICSCEDTITLLKTSFMFPNKMKTTRLY